jgi:5-methylcytosine-specific restriction endonuclease McrA
MSLSGVDCHVLMSIGKYANSSGWCFFNQGKLAKELGIARKSVNRAVANLAKRGYITKRDINDGKPGSRLQSICQYQLIFKEHEVKEKSLTPTKAPSEDKIKEFYDSDEWKRSRVRYQALKEADGRCQCCGASRKDGVRLVVDHIKPVRKHWEQRLDPDNMQVLCDECNRGKASWDETDWRDSATASHETTE